MSRKLFTRTLLLLFTAALSTSNAPVAATNTICPFESALPPTDVLIGYIGNTRQTNNIRVGSFRVLGIIRDGRLIKSDGSTISAEMKLWKVNQPESPPTNLVDVSSFLDRMGKDHCVFHAQPAEDLPLWTLLSSQPVNGELREPDASEKTYFAEQRNSCIDQGGYPASSKPPCSQPELLVVSDLNHDGNNEYWATEPYRWDTGITIWERTATGLARVHSVCVGCSD